MNKLILILIILSLFSCSKKQEPVQAISPNIENDLLKTVQGNYEGEHEFFQIINDEILCCIAEPSTYKINKLTKEIITPTPTVNNPNPNQYTRIKMDVVKIKQGLYNQDINVAYYTEGIYNNKPCYGYSFENSNGNIYYGDSCVRKGAEWYGAFKNQTDDVSAYTDSVKEVTGFFYLDPRDNQFYISSLDNTKIKITKYQIDIDRNYDYEYWNIHNRLIKKFLLDDKNRIVKITIPDEYTGEFIFSSGWRDTSFLNIKNLTIFEYEDDTLSNIIERSPQFIIDRSIYGGLIDGKTYKITVNQKGYSGINAPTYIPIIKIW